MTKNCQIIFKVISKYCARVTKALRGSITITFLETVVFIVLFRTRQIKVRKKVYLLLIFGPPRVTRTVVEKKNFFRDLKIAFTIFNFFNNILQENR